MCADLNVLRALQVFHREVFLAVYRMSTIGSLLIGSLQQSDHSLAHSFANIHVRICVITVVPTTRSLHWRGPALSSLEAKREA
eukprot:SAG31_NODE_1158_length_9605_cov_2.788555_6_plen_83_part_00